MVYNLCQDIAGFLKPASVVEKPAPVAEKPAQDREVAQHRHLGQRGSRGVALHAADGERLVVMQPDLGLRFLHVEIRKRDAAGARSAQGIDHLRDPA